MYECPRCGVKIAGSKKCCPLCRGELQGEASPSVFPISKRKRFTTLTLIKISTFALTVLAVILFAVRMLSEIENGTLMTVFLIGLIAYADFLLGIYFHSNLLKVIHIQTYAIMMICLGIDYFTGWHSWSVSWVVPIGFLFLLVVTYLIGESIDLFFGEFVLYIAIDMILSLLQLIPLVLDFNYFRFPAVISMSIMMILFSGSIIFRFRELKTALHKLFSL